jgi:hypothetical protein
MPKTFLELAAGFHASKASTWNPSCLVTGDNDILSDGQQSV